MAVDRESSPVILSNTSLRIRNFRRDEKKAIFSGDNLDQINQLLVGKWADPGGTAMPGQLLTRPEQAPEPHPLAKISLISKRTHGSRIRY